MGDQGLEEAIQRDHEASNALLRGDPSPKKEMFSRRDDVTLANPLGPPVQGADAVRSTLDRVASQILEGLPHEFERIAEYTSTDLACVVEIEKTGVRFVGSDRVRPFSLRATTIWRREDGDWLIAHRHADPITTPRPLESVFEH